MVPLSKRLRLYVPSAAFSPASDAFHSLLSPSFTSMPCTEHITIDDEPVAFAAVPCLDFATISTDVTSTQDASTAPPLQPDFVDLAAAILPERLVFDPQAGNPPDYETDCIIHHLNQRHEYELSRL